MPPHLTSPPSPLSPLLSLPFPQVSALMHDEDIWMKGDTDSTLLSVITDGFLIKGHKARIRREGRRGGEGERGRGRRVS